ncbi:MAG TPA: glyoxalase superfamily protein [Sphingomicrobium sp.]|jgi:catechol 2,3-dioxygenase-like lactoylglutathione lyase family enzyme|nr:glyoxalase superfamily protein [Sphingomicrobium sp.]
MFGSPTPILRSFDERRAKRFYVEFLGFEILFERRFEPNSPLYMGLRKGDCVLHLSEHYGDGTPGSVTRIPAHDVKALAVELREKNFENARPGDPQLMDWGSWELTIHDPASNRLTFYTQEKP